MTAKVTRPCPGLAGLSDCPNEVEGVTVSGQTPGEHHGGGEVAIIDRTIVIPVGLCDECAEQEEAAAAAQAAVKLEIRITDAGIPSTLRAAEAKTMDTAGGRDSVIAAAREWAEADRPGGLCLFGPVGVGKTRLAAAAALMLLRRRSVRWVSVPVLLARAGAAFNDQARASAIADITGRRALVLDDLDKLNPSEWALTQLFAAIDTRVQAGAPLLVTTNLSPGALAGKLGDPIASRVAGYCRVLELRGQDYRLKAGGQPTTQEDT